METALIVIVIVLAVLLVVAFIFIIYIALHSRKNADKPEQSTHAELDVDAVADKVKDKISTDIVPNLTASITQSVGSLNTGMEGRVNASLGTTNEAIQKVQKSITEVQTTQNKLDSLETSVLRLNKMLDNSQLRGQYGEYTLYKILESMFGTDDEHQFYQKQYPLTDDARPDAVLFLTSGLLLCIDSKFPMKAYEDYYNCDFSTDKAQFLKMFDRALRTQIDKIANTYIIQGKTFGQALMYIPDDGIYAFICHDMSDTRDYATSHNVNLVSPSILGPVVAGIDMIRIEQLRNDESRVLTQQLYTLGDDFDRFADRWKDVFKDIEHLYNDSSDLNISSRKITNKFNQIQKYDVKNGIVSPGIVAQQDSNAIESKEANHSDE